VTGTTIKTVQLTLADGTQLTSSFIDNTGGGSGGSISINSDTTSLQYLATGTSGSDFNINDNSSGVHTFNLPFASNLSIGKLDSSYFRKFDSSYTIIKSGVVRTESDPIIKALNGVVIGNNGSANTAVTGTANQLLRRNNANTAFEFFTPSYLTGDQTVYDSIISKRQYLTNRGDLDTIFTNIDDSTIGVKSIRVVGGTNVTVVPTITDSTVNYQISSTGGGGHDFYTQDGRITDPTRNVYARDLKFRDSLFNYLDINFSDSTNPWIDAYVQSIDGSNWSEIYQTKNGVFLYNDNSRVQLTNKTLYTQVDSSIEFSSLDTIYRFYGLNSSTALKPLFIGNNKLSVLDTLVISPTDEWIWWGQKFGTYYGKIEMHYSGGVALDVDSKNPYTPNHNEFSVSAFGTFIRNSYLGDTALISVMSDSAYSQIRVRAKYIDLEGLSTDNTATQVFAKDANGHGAWRDVSSISGGGAGILTGDNGLTLSTPTNLQFGGIMTKNDTLNGQNLRTLLLDSLATLNINVKSGLSGQFNFKQGGNLRFQVSNTASELKSPDLGSYFHVQNNQAYISTNGDALLASQQSHFYSNDSTIWSTTNRRGVISIYQDSLHIYSDDAAIELSHAEGITLEPPLGVLTIDSLTSGAITDSVMVWNKLTGRTGYRNASSFGGTPSLTQYYVGVGNSSNQLSGSSNLQFNGSNELIIGGTDNGSYKLQNKDSSWFGNLVVIDALNNNFPSGYNAGLKINGLYSPSVWFNSTVVADGFLYTMGYSGQSTFNLLSMNSSSVQNVLWTWNWDGTTSTNYDFAIAANKYLNWGSTFGSSGYGFRDNTGVIEFKNSGGSWKSLTPGVTPIDVQTTDVGNTSTTETDLHTTSIAGNTLSSDKDGLDFSFTDSLAANTNSKVIKIYFGSTAIIMPANTHAAGGSVEITGRIIRASSTTAEISGVMSSQNGTAVYPFHATVSSLDFTSSITLKSTGTGGSTGDITELTSSVRKINHP
jgi:hypothetical protein